MFDIRDKRPLKFARSPILLWLIKLTSMIFLKQHANFNSRDVFVVYMLLVTGVKV